MKNKFIKSFFIVFILFIFISNIRANNIDEYINEQTKYEVLIEDDANLLTEQEILQLKESMKPLTEYGNVIFKTINTNPHTTATYASKYYDEKYKNESGTLFLIDMDRRYVYIYSSGKNYKIITKDKANIITDNIYKYATNKQYYLCAINAFEQVNTLLDGGKILEPMRYISNILISIIIAFFINFFIALVNSKINVAKNKEILSKCKIIFNIKNIIGEKVGEYSVYSPRSSSSSGGDFFGGSSSGGGFSGGRSSGGGSSSGGGFSGGRSSGGGGGHRF